MRPILIQLVRHGLRSYSGNLFRDRRSALRILRRHFPLIRNEAAGERVRQRFLGDYYFDNSIIIRTYLKIIELMEVGSFNCMHGSVEQRAVGTDSGSIFPRRHIPEGRPGRKPVPARAVLEAVLWILNTGAQWLMLSQSYPNYKTVHRRFQQWCERQVLRDVLTKVANALREQGEINESESYIDTTFASAKGGGDEIGKTRRGKGVKIMAIVDRHGMPLSVSTHAANHRRKLPSCS